MYFLPVGQGDATVIQCPSGDLTLYDWGSNTASRARFWTGTELKEYLKDSFKLIKNIVVTHHHFDHYSLLQQTFGDATKLPGLLNIYMPCTADVKWVKDAKFGGKAKVFNKGEPCGPIKGSPCGALKLCPEGDEVTIEVLAANMGGCKKGTENLDSIVTKLTRGKLSILLSGDFEGSPQQTMVDFYTKQEPNPLPSVVYQAAHHGAIRLANTAEWLNAIAPKAVVSSGVPWYQYGHPRCDMFDGLTKLCEPDPDDPKSKKKCPYDGSSTQNIYTCGISKKDFKPRPNKKAIYTTVPDGCKMNLIEVESTAVSGWKITRTQMDQKRIKQDDKTSKTPEDD